MGSVTYYKVIKMPAPKDPKKFLEYKEKMSGIAKERGFGLWMKGKPGTMLGKHQPDSAKEILSKKFKVIAKEKGFGLWMRGRHGFPAAKALGLLSSARSGKTYEEIYGDRAFEEAEKRKVGNLRRWIGKVRRDARPQFNRDSRYEGWRVKVFKRDNWTCQHCGFKGGWVEAHHKKSWAKYVELRYDVDNGITLCKPCHIREGRPPKVDLKASEFV